MTYAFYSFYLLVLSLFSVFTEQENFEPLYRLLTAEEAYPVNDNFKLQFLTNSNDTPLVYVSNSYGSSLITPQRHQDTLNYIFPKHLSSKSGVCSWQLLDQTIKLSGDFYLKALSKTSEIETYMGPPSIEAGGKDFTMLVVIPTDSLDNPIKNKTPVIAKHQFLNIETEATVYTKHFIAYKNLYSYEKKGRILISSKVDAVNSKEFTLNVTSSLPKNFSMYAQRAHGYADGNQITTLSTSVIKDAYNNTVTDGTFVSFIIRTNTNQLLQTNGLTLNGIATAKMIHPDRAAHWTVNAYISGMAESNTLNLKYAQVITDFTVTFSKSNRLIHIGPLKSFMDQLIPDGLHVKLGIYQDNQLLKSFVKTSYNGSVDFFLKPEIFDKGHYHIQITTAGIEKKQQITL